MRRAVFLDRDGTLNVEKGYIRDIDELELYPGAAQAVRLLNDAGILAILVTNQTGAARGYYTIEHVHALNRRVQELLSRRQVPGLMLCTYCPHYTDGIVPEFTRECDCRKPAPGMILQAARDFADIDLAASFVVGDKATDIAFASNAGCRGILVRTGYGDQVLAGEYQMLEVQPEKVCADIVEAVAYILSQPVGS